jgi:hypothetical protein
MSLSLSFAFNNLQLSIMGKTARPALAGARSSWRNPLNGAPTV